MALTAEQVPSLGDNLKMGNKTGKISEDRV